MKWIRITIKIDRRSIFMVIRVDNYGFWCDFCRFWLKLCKNKHNFPPMLRKKEGFFLPYGQKKKGVFPPPFLKTPLKGGYWEHWPGGHSWHVIESVGALNLTVQKKWWFRSPAIRVTQRQNHNQSSSGSVVVVSSLSDSYDNRSKPPLFLDGKLSFREITVNSIFLDPLILYWHNARSMARLISPCSSIWTKTQILYL